jgi:hypothetical protein
MITPFSNLPNLSSIEIRSSASNPARERPGALAAGQRTPAHPLRMRQPEALRHVNASRSERAGADTLMRRPAPRISLTAAPAFTYGHTVEPAGVIGRATNSVDHCRYPSAPQLADVRRRITSRVAELVNTMPGQKSAIYDQLAIHCTERELIYAQYMAGYFNGRLGPKELRVLCGFLQHYQMLAPFQYIAEKEREFVRNRMTVSAYKTGGVGTLRDEAIKEYDSFLQFLVSHHHNPPVNEASQQERLALRKSMAADLDPIAIIRFAETGELNKVIVMLSMKDAGDVSDLCSDDRLAAIKVALMSRHDNIAMHLLMHFETSGRRLYPEKLTRCLQGLLAFPNPHPDLLWKLIELGANPDAQGYETGNTSLHIACLHGHSLLSDFLRNEMQADAGIVNADARTAKDLIPDPKAKMRRQPAFFTWVQ